MSRALDLSKLATSTSSALAFRAENFQRIALVVCTRQDIAEYLVTSVSWSSEHRWVQLRAAMAGLESLLRHPGRNLK